MKFKILSALILLTFSFSNTGNAQSADEIIDKHIKAIGGAEKLSALKSVILEAKVNAQGMEIPMTMTTVQNKGWRMDISLMGMNGWMVMRPDSGWVFMPFQGQTKPEAMPQDAIKEGLSQLDIQGVLLDYKKKGHEVSYLGLDDVEGTECHKLKLTTKEGTVNYFLIDPASSLIVKTINKRKAGGQEMEVESLLSNYKDVDGYMMAHTITSQMGPLEIVKITINPEIPASKFSMSE
ncbi:MAG: hypothetical protein IPH93_14935 [Saprospiraceae bacterium]|nr:hypothetical protein [Saprospiraceae bacterium]MBK9630395.1 hypothetical protein [Saprospiraceae bacterium]